MRAYDDVEPPILPKPVLPPLRIALAGKDVRSENVLKELGKRARRSVIPWKDGDEGEPDFRVSVTDQDSKDTRLGYSYLGTNFINARRNELRRIAGFQPTHEDRALSGIIWHEMLHHARKTQDHEKEGLMAAKPSLNALLSDDYPTE